MLFLAVCQIRASIRLQLGNISARFTCFNNPTFEREFFMSHGSSLDIAGVSSILAIFYPLHFRANTLP